MRWILNVAYLGLLFAWLPLLLFQRVVGKKKRSGWRAKLWGDVLPESDPQPLGGRVAWFHAVSVGEVRVLERLVAAFSRRYPGWEIVISTTTSSGMGLAQKRFANHRCVYLPFDFSWAVSRAIEQLRPNLFVSAELEVWPNLIAELHRRSIPIAIVNGRLSENSFRGYRRLRFLLSRTFSRLSLVAVQTETYAERFRALGVATDQVVSTGSMKFDGLATDPLNRESQELRRKAGITASDRIWLVGSTQPEEDRLALEIFSRIQKHYPDLRLIICPRHPERFVAAADEIAKTGLAWQRRQSLDATKPWRILLVDTIGELSAWWGTASLAYVGGSMGSRGGQNMIEPAAFGAAVSFGPNTENFRDVVDALLAREAAQVVADVDQMQSFVCRCLDDAAWRSEMGSRAQAWVVGQQGATESTLDAITRLLNSHESPSQAKQATATRAA